MERNSFLAEATFNVTAFLDQFCQNKNVRIPEIASVNKFSVFLFQVALTKKRDKNN